MNGKNSDDWADQEEAFFGHAISPRSNRPATSSGSSTTWKSVQSGGASYAALEKLRSGARSVGDYVARRGSQLDATAELLASRDRARPEGAVARPPTTPSNFCAPVQRPVRREDEHHNDQRRRRRRRRRLPGEEERSDDDRDAVVPSSSSSGRRSRGGLGSAFRNQASDLWRAASASVPRCVVCGTNTVLLSSHQYHPFFPSERACASHRDPRRCCACHRFEPDRALVLSSTSRREEFADLQDNDRRLCPACLRTVVTDADDAVPLWNEVLNFFGSPSAELLDNDGGGRLGARMARIPVLVVGHAGLNDPGVRRSSGHVGATTTTRGLCLYEYRDHPGGGHLRDLLERRRRRTGDNGDGGLLGSLLDSAARAATASHVTAILCLKGMPRDLVGSVLAHEATHAWFKLHPRYDPRRPIPLQVEEGCCQLSAYLYLRWLEDDRRRRVDNNDDDGDDDGQPSDAKLRQYFRFCIETDTSEVYGEGFRKAARAHADLNSVSDLFEHVAEHRCFPTL